MFNLRLREEVQHQLFLTILPLSTTHATPQYTPYHPLTPPPVLFRPVFETYDDPRLIENLTARPGTVHIHRVPSMAVAPKAGAKKMTVAALDTSIPPPPFYLSCLLLRTLLPCALLLASGCSMFRVGPPEQRWSSGPPHPHPNPVM